MKAQNILQTFLNDTLVRLCLQLLTIDWNVLFGMLAAAVKRHYSVHRGRWGASSFYCSIETSRRFHLSATGEYAARRWGHGGTMGGCKLTWIWNCLPLWVIRCKISSISYLTGCTTSHSNETCIVRQRSGMTMKSSLQREMGNWPCSKILRSLLHGFWGWCTRCSGLSKLSSSILKER